MDLLGNPNTVTPLADELLDVTIQLRYYPPLVDVLGQVTVQGILYDTICRAASVTVSDYWGRQIGTAVGEHVVYTSWWAAYDGDIGPITTGPSGTSAGIDATSNVVNAPYSANSFQRDMSFNVGPGGWNPPSALGIRSVFLVTTAGAYQIQFNAVSDGSRIPKHGGRTMNGLFRVGWTEAVIP